MTVLGQGGVAVAGVPGSRWHRIRGITSRELDGFIDPVSQGRKESLGPAVVSAA